MLTNDQARIINQITYRQDYRKAKRIVNARLTGGGKRTKTAEPLAIDDVDTLLKLIETLKGNY